MILDLPPKPAIIRATELPKSPIDLRGIVPTYQEQSFGPLPMFMTAGALGGKGGKLKGPVFKGTFINIANATSYTFSFPTYAIDFGQEHEERRILVAINPQRDADVNATIASCSIGGISATQLVSRFHGRYTSALYIAHVPTNNNLSVVVATSSIFRCGIAIYSLYGLTSNTAFHTGNSIANPGSITLNTAAGGFAVFTAANINNGGNHGVNNTWTNAIEDYDQPMGEGNTEMTGATSFNTPQGSLNVLLTRIATSGTIQPMVGVSFSFS